MKGNWAWRFVTQLFVVETVYSRVIWSYDGRDVDYGVEVAVAQQCGGEIKNFIAGLQT